MSGIYISGVEAPKTCYECYRRGLKSVVGCTHDIVGINKNREEKIPSWCKIQPISVHGRVIEADPIMKYIVDGLNSGEFGYDQIKVLTEIQYAPTIITADKEKEV